MLSQKRTKLIELHNRMVNDPSRPLMLGFVEPESTSDFQIEQIRVGMSASERQQAATAILKVFREFNSVIMP